MTSRQFKLLAWTILLSLPAFMGALLWGRVHFAGDVLYSFHPWLSYAAQNIQAGHWPLWNPYTVCGEPFLANPQVMVYFPLALIFWVFPFAPAWAAFIALNEACAFLGMTLLARHLSGGKNSFFPSLLAGFAYAWGGFATVAWEFPAALAALAAVPWFVLACLARRWAGVMLAGAWMVFAGYPQFALYGFLAGGLAVLFFDARKAGLWLAACAGAGALALCQILPTAEAALASARTAVGGEEAGAFLLSFPFLTKFLAPDILPKMATSYSGSPFDPMLWPIQRNWLNTFFIGHLPLIFAAATMKDWKRRPVVFLWAIFAAGILLATGAEPLAGMIRATPLISGMTHYANAMLLCVFALALLAAQTNDSDLDKIPRRVWAIWGIAAASVFVLYAGGAEPLVRALTGLAELTREQAAWSRRACLSAGAGLLAAGLIFILPARLRRAGVFALTFFQLWNFSRGLHPTAPADFFLRDAPLARMIQADQGRFVIDPFTLKNPKPMAGDDLAAGTQSLRQVLYPNIHLPFRISAAWGYEVFRNRRFTEFRRTVPDDFVASPQAVFLGEKHILTTRALPPPAALVAQRANGLYYRYDGALEDTHWVAQAKAIPNPAERLAYLSGPWNPRGEVVLENEREAGYAGYCVRPVIFYPGWEAYAEGRRVMILRANHAFQAVPALSGGTPPEFVYRPWTFRLGLLSTVLSILGLGVYGWAWARRRLRAKTI